ncbi:TPA: hypothetical protein OPR08_002024 [Citrobacter koseri]|uniref:DUF6484 domain-containing protein n=1 Tax=Citrobacter koseri TaxID=545 RepID=UPI00066862E5|nr:DUF6484 domain-containing protein [Citrobacter koseri]RZA56921.1 hypothetical protein EVX99_22675 [Citrobacter koseri]HCR9749819.1 hypothetical protein [Citrobacter koseri]HCR9769220.1 hypothetical protein [Citrobacter koseri]HEM6800230.1 hypothetical protein [Citrobacter koseri]HEM7948793.1 hypothetical protein [Citrobacter koseri]
MHSDTSVSPSADTDEKYTELLDEILKQDGSQPSVNPHDIILGRIRKIDDSEIIVEFDGIESKTTSICPLGKEDVDKTCAIQFIQGDLNRPLVMGLIHSTMSVKSTKKTDTGDMLVTRQGKQVVIQADDELVLQCGESCIVMTAEGTVYIRALYIDSHAQATQRLRGGSVQVN